MISPHCRSSLMTSRHPLTPFRPHPVGPVLFFLKNFLFCIDAKLIQCFVSFNCTEKWFSYTFTYILYFSYSFSILVITKY